MRKWLLIPLLIIITTGIIFGIIFYGSGGEIKMDSIMPNIVASHILPQTVSPYHHTGTFKYYLSGNESKTVDSVNFIGRQVTIIYKNSSDRTYTECDENEKNCAEVTYQVPASSPVKNLLGVELTNLNKQVSLIATPYDYITYTIPDDLRYLQIGEGTVTIIEDIDAHGVFEDVVAEENYTHLNITSDAPYGNLTLYLSFDSNISSAVVYDYTQNNQDGAITGAIYNESGKYGGSLQYDGVDDYVTISDDAMQTSTGGVSFSVWAYTDNTADDKMIIYKYDSTSKDGYGLWIQNSPNRFEGKFWQNADSCTPDSNAVPSTGWKHFVIVRNDSNTCLMYVNGVLQSTTGTVSGTIDSSGNLYLGVDLNLNKDWNGSIDEFMMFNGSLSQAQVTAIYTNQSARFKMQGNATYNLTITAGNNRTNITSYIEELEQSSIEMRIWDNGNNGWSAWQNVSNSVNNTFNINSSSTILNITYRLYSNATTQFYSPIHKNEIVIDTWSDVGVAETPDNQDRYEYYNMSDVEYDTNVTLINKTYWRYQNFTVGVVGENTAFNISNISLFMNKTGTPEWVNISIQSTLGTTLVTGRFNASTLNGDTFEWINVSMDKVETTSADSQYYMVIWCDSCPSGSFGQIKRHAIGSTYTGGEYGYSSNAGSSWNTLSNYELWFEVWGVNTTVAEADTQYPIFYNITDTNSTVEGTYATFWANVNSTNGTVILQTYNILQTPTDYINYTASNTSNLYNVTINLSLTYDPYTYWWAGYGNGTSNLFNITREYYYTVNSTRIPNLTITFPSNTTYFIPPNQLNYTVAGNNLQACLWSNDSFVNHTITCGNNVTNMNATEGSNTWHVSANDSWGNLNHTFVTYILDRQAPSFYNINDSNSTYAGEYAWFNVSINNTNGTVFLQINSTNYTAYNLTANMYNVTVNLTSPITHTYFWSAYGNGTINRYNTSAIFNYDVNETIVGDNKYPSFYNYSYTNSTYSGQYVTFRTNINATNGTTFLQIGETNYTASNSSNIFNVTANLTTTGTFLVMWSSFGNGTSAYYNTSAINYTTVNATIILTPPNLSIIQPENTTYNTIVKQLNYTVSGENDACMYFNGTANATITCGENVTILGVEGANTFGVYSNNTADFTNSTFVTFTQDTQYPIFYNYIDNNATYSGQYARFNITVNNTNGTVFLELNGTNYTVYNLTSSVYNLTINLTTTGDYPYYWLAWGNGTLNRYNVSAIRYFSVNSSVTIDTTPPTFTSIPSNQSIIYEQGFDVEFNATDETAFNTYTINWSIYFEVNSSGGLYNTTKLGVQRYYINVTINDSSNNTNYAIFWVEVNKSPDITASLTNDAGWASNWGTTVTTDSSETNEGDSDVTYDLWRDNVTVGTSEAVNLSAGTYHYLLNTTGGMNWTNFSSLDNNLLTITKGTGVASLFVNGSQSNFLMNNDSANSCQNIPINASSNYQTTTANIWTINQSHVINNGTASIQNLTNISIGYWQYNATYGGNINITPHTESWYVNCTTTVIVPAVRVPGTLQIVVIKPLADTDSDQIRTIQIT